MLPLLVVPTVEVRQGSLHLSERLPVVPKSEGVFISSVEPFKHAHTVLLRNLAPDLRAVLEAGLLKSLTGKVRTAVALNQDGSVNAERAQHCDAFVERDFSQLHRQTPNHLACQHHPGLHVEYVINPAHAVSQ